MFIAILVLIESHTNWQMSKLVPKITNLQTQRFPRTRLTKSRYNFRPTISSRMIFLIGGGIRQRV